MHYLKKIPAHCAILLTVSCALIALAGCSAEPTDSVALSSPQSTAPASFVGGEKTELVPTQLVPNHLAQRPASQAVVNPAETDHLPLWPPTTNPSPPAPAAVPPLFPANPPPPPLPTEQPLATEFAPPAFTSPQFEPASPAPPATAPVAAVPSDENPLRASEPQAPPIAVPAPSSIAAPSTGNPLRLNAPGASPAWGPPTTASSGLPTRSPNLAAPTSDNLLPSAPLETHIAPAPAAVPFAPSTTTNEQPSAAPTAEAPQSVAALPKPLPKITNKAASRPPRVPTHPQAHAEWSAKQKLAAAEESPSGGSARASDYDPSAYGPAPQPQSPPRMMELGAKQDPPASAPEVNAPSEGAVAANPPSGPIEIPSVPVFDPPTFEPAPIAAGIPAATPDAVEPAETPAAPPSFEPPTFQPVPEVPAPAVEPTAAEPIAQPPSDAPQKTTALVPATSSNDPFDVVRVFYGTDRLAEHVNRDTLLMRLIRFTPAAVLIGLSVFGVFVLLTSRKISWILGTGTMLVCSVLAVWHGISETIEIAQLAAQEEPSYSADKSVRGKVELGICEVSIPKTHEPGALETPLITRLEFEFNPAEHITLRKTVRLHNDAFYEQLREQVASSPNRELLVFVHGFNVSFDDAARRTAQMANDLKLQGAPVFFSWPADKYFLLTYGKDETSVSWSAPHLREFLLDLVHNTDARAINLVAHSMGNRALTTALREIDLQLRNEARLFNQVVLAAPDIDADDFRDNIAPAIQRTAKQVTLYASAHDRALAASRLIHRNARAGDTSEGLVLVPGVVTIDVSNIDGGPWGHSYYGASDPVLRDLHLLLTSLPPERRTWLNMKELDGQTYWAFKPLTSASAPSLIAPR
ncbi:alpha/beta hydrolase [Anatilimnocola floriformis]|uniref:alpha/beta hydrolase n=1 Tax=Anatilimnocola floriformis TaxID=2948575 RepID=UPI0020C48EE8|nr:alpha/beta hydrolase [Anatilimnocola floriformis]